MFKTLFTSIIIDIYANPKCKLLLTVLAGELFFAKFRIFLMFVDAIIYSHSIGIILL